MRLPRSLLTGFAVLTIGPMSPGVAQKRTMVPEDLFSIEQVSFVSWSPNGRFVAVVMSPGQRAIDGSVLDERIWILDTHSRAFDRLEIPNDSVVGVWHPAWSPDGDRLAFLVIDSQAVVSPWIWKTGESLPFRIDGVDLQVNYDDPPVVWLDSRRLVLLAWAPGATKGGSLFMRVLRGHHAPELWRRARAGRTATVTTLEFGGNGENTADAEVVLVDVHERSRRTLFTGSVHRLFASPDGNRLAYFSGASSSARRATGFFEHSELYDAVNWGSELHVFDLLSNAEGIAPVDILDAGYYALDWSFHNQLILPGRVRGETSGTGVLVSRNGRMESLDVPQLTDLDPGTARWFDGHVLIWGKMEATDRWDWWLVAPGAARNLTGRLSAVPPRLIEGPDGAVLGDVDGDVWRILPTGEIDNLTTSVRERITGLRSLSADGRVLRATVDSEQAIIRVVDDSVTLTPIQLPRSGSRLRAVSPDGDSFIATGDFSDGTTLWIGGGGGRPGADAVIVWRGNTWVNEIEPGTEEYFLYTGTDGQTYGAWLLTPPAVVSQSLPLVVDIYPGQIQEETSSPFAVLSTYFLNPQLFAAQGYAVLRPSVPDLNGFRGAERLQALTVGIFPAVDTLIQRGVVDAHRLALVGQSAGGYATLGLIGQTTRFKAAIASASYSNLISLYGTFYGQRRWGDGGDPQAGQVLRMLQLERGYASMGGPPWERIDDYLGASPLFHVSSVETPVMLVHGDFDFIPIEQAEEYFTALYRQDKRVQFVRYHGEQHTPSTRGNVIDLWRRITDWLGELIGP